MRNSQLSILYYVCCHFTTQTMGVKKGYLSNNRKEDSETDRVRKKRQQTVKGERDMRGQDPWG